MSIILLPRRIKLRRRLLNTILASKRLEKSSKSYRIIIYILITI